MGGAGEPAAQTTPGPGSPAAALRTNPPVGRSERCVLRQVQSRLSKLCHPRVRHAVQTQPRANKRRRGGEDDEGEDGEGLVPAEMTARILKQARSQQEELDAEEMPAGGPGCRPLFLLFFEGQGGHQLRGKVQMPWGAGAVLNRLCGGTECCTATSVAAQHGPSVHQQHHHLS